MNDTEGLEEEDSFPLTEDFSVGKVFSVDVLDSLMAAVSHQEAGVPVLIPLQSSPMDTGFSLDVWTQGSVWM